MFGIIVTLFLAGILTILLPCILPLVPIVVGASVADRNKWRPLITCLGLIVGFVGSTFVLQVFLRHFSLVADTIRIATFYVLLLLGMGFVTHARMLRWTGAFFGALFFLSRGLVAVFIAAVSGIIAIEIGALVASRLQSAGASLQSSAREGLGAQSHLTSFVIGLTLGLVWVPCAGPALAFALVLVRDRPGLEAFAALTAYATGAAVPLLIVGYGGQAAVHSVRAIAPYTERIKQAAGALMVLCALALYSGVFVTLQTWIVEHTSFGRFADRLEQKLVEGGDSPAENIDGELPVLGQAPVLLAEGPWHNSSVLTDQDLRGKIVLVDFWTYSCINCIRTLPYVQGYWDKYKGTPFILLGVHTPEFAFEQEEKNVADAIAKYHLTYPVVQDNDYAVWRSYSNRYWPAKYLVDAQGRVRYVHFGEGGYAETDAAIAALLKEMGEKVQASSVSQQEEGGRPQTPETYFSGRGGSAFGNAAGDASESQVYTVPAKREFDRYYLAGTWQLVKDERQVLRSQTGSIVLSFLGAECNIVLGSESGASAAEATVYIDGEKTSTLSVDHHDLYPLFTGEYGRHEVRLDLRGTDVGAYAFTFGS